ncbi:MAG: hypothetical protein ACHQT8_01450 [Chlamydiales bacterium]
MFILKICAALSDAKVPYAIVGGYAVALHGAVRGTVDLDLVIRWSLKNLRNMEVVLKQMGLISRIPVTAEDLFRFREEYIHKRNLIAWNFYDPSNPLNQVDIIVTHDLNSQSHVKKVNTSMGVINVLSMSELIKMKKAAGRPQDLQDVQALINLQAAYE